MEGFNHACSLITKIVILGPLIFKMPFLLSVLTQMLGKFEFLLESCTNLIAFQMDIQRLLGFLRIYVANFLNVER